MPTIHPRTLNTTATTDLLSPMPSLHLVICTDRRGRIGTANNLLYRIPLDTQRFTSLTTRTTDPDKTNVVLMGYATWASLPDKYRPLPDRLNAVLTRSPEKACVRFSVSCSALIGGAGSALSHERIVCTVRYPQPQPWSEWPKP